MPRSPRFRLRLLSAAVLAALLAATGGAVWGAHELVQDQEQRLLVQRTAEVGLVLTEAINTLPSSLSELGGSLEGSNGSTAAFQKAAEAEAAGTQGTAFAWVRPAAGGFQVLAASGPPLAAGQVLTGVRADILARALHTPKMVPTPVIGSGAQRAFGLALGPPAAPAGTVLYRESALGPVAPPRQAATQPFSELDVVLYAAPRTAPTQVLVSTTRTLPLHGAVYQHLTVGSASWLLGASARAPLVGGWAESVEWIVLAVGLMGAALISVVVEMAARRRDAALALYAAEHEVAEALQLSLLPELPQLPAVELAARYLTSGRGQQVGGDWFDVFPVGDDRVGIVVGDVIGHDIAAASAMSQVRAALRAYAWTGDDPALVIEHLDELVGRFSLTSLVTVFYGLLDAPDAAGSRTLRYTNAGHPPPLILEPGGSVRHLDLGVSALIGAPVAAQRGAVRTELESGSSIVLYTDGLVELPGVSLDASLDRLAATVSGHRPDAGAEALCERIIGSMSEAPRRDDLALLVIRLLAPTAPPPVYEVVGERWLGSSTS